MLYNFKLCRHKFYNRFQMSPCIEGYGENIVYESKNCCKLNLYTFLLKNQKLSFSVNRINLNYGEEIKLTKSEKLLHSYKVLGEWKSTRGHFHLGQIYNSEHSIHLGDKLWKKQHYSALNVYERFSAKSVKFWKTFWFVWRILERNSWKVTDLFPSTNLDIIEKELMRSTKSYHALNKHRYIMDFWINPS